MTYRPSEVSDQLLNALKRVIFAKGDDLDTFRLKQPELGGTKGSKAIPKPVMAINRDC